MNKGEMMNPSGYNDSLLNESSAGMQLPITPADFLDMAFNAVIAYDSKEQITFWNPAAEQMYGWTAREALGKTLSDLFGPKNIFIGQEDQRQGLEHLKPRATIQGENSLRCKDGSLLPVEYRARPIFNEGGAVIGHMMVHRDITERKQTGEEIGRLNAELQTQLEEYNTLIEMLPMGIWIGNHDCSVITGNPAAYRIMGLTPGINASVTNREPEVPLDLRIFVDGVEVAPEDAPMQRVARSGEPMYNLEHELLFSDQTRKTVYASIVPVFDGQGAVRKVIAAYADINERKQVEEELRLAHERAKQTADRLTRLQNVTEALSKSLTPALVAEVLVKQGVPALGAAIGSIALLTEDRQSLEIVYSAAPEHVTRPYKHYSVSLDIPAAEAVRLGQSIWIESREQYIERYPHLADQIIVWGH